MKIPPPQDYLNKEARVIYKKIADMLENHDALEDVDSYGLSQMAYWLWLFHNSADAVKDTGGMQITANGYSQVTAEITIMDKASARFEKLSTKYGMSPKDREAIVKFKSQKKQVDRLDKI